MKKIFLIIIAFLIVQEVPAQVRLSTMDSITTLVSTDIFYLNHYSGSFLNRQLSWSNLRTNTKNWLDDQSVTWTAIQTFNGATFSAGSHGKVTFVDSMVATGNAYIEELLPYDSYSYVGWATQPYWRMYATVFVVMNSAGTDSVVISYDEDNNTLNLSDVTISNSITIDSSATFDVIAFTPHSYTITDAGDTTLTLTSTDRYSLIELDLPANISPGISRLYVQGAQKGMVIRFYNGDASYTMEFKDYVGSDDNLYMDGDFASMGQYDYIEFQCVVESIVGQTWMQTGRSNN